MDSTVEYNKPNQLQMLGLDPATMATPQSNSAAENEKKVAQDPVLSTIVKPQPDKPSSLQAAGLDPATVGNPKTDPRQQNQPNQTFGGLPDTLAIVNNGKPKDGQTLTLPSGTTIHNEEVRLSNGLTGNKATMIVPGADHPLVSAPSVGYSEEQIAGLFTTSDSYSAEQRNQDLALLNGPRKQGPYTPAALAADEVARAAATARLNQHWNPAALQGGSDGALVLPGPGYSPVQIANDLRLAATTGVLDEASDRKREEARERLDRPEYVYTKEEQDQDQVNLRYQYLPVDHPDRQKLVQGFIDNEGLTPAQAQQAVWRNAFTARQRLDQAGIPLLDPAQARELENTPRAYAFDPSHPTREVAPDPHKFTETDFRNFLRDASGLGDLTDGIYNGDIGQAAFGAAMTGLTFFPSAILGPVLRPLGRGAGKLWNKIAPPEIGDEAAIAAELAAQAAARGTGTGAKLGETTHAPTQFHPWDPQPGTSLYVPNGARPYLVPDPPAIPAKPGGASPNPAELIDPGYSVNGRPFPGDPTISPWRSPRPNTTPPWDPGYRPFTWPGDRFRREPGWYKGFGRSDEPGAHAGPLASGGENSRRLPEGILQGVDEKGRAYWWNPNTGRRVTMEPWAKVPSDIAMRGQLHDTPLVTIETGLPAYEQHMLDQVNDLQNVDKAARNQAQIELNNLIDTRKMTIRNADGTLRALTIDDLSTSKLERSLANLQGRYEQADLKKIGQLADDLSINKGAVAGLSELRGEIGGDYAAEKVLGMEIIHRGINSGTADSVAIAVDAEGNRRVVLLEYKGGNKPDSFSSRSVEVGNGSRINVEQGTLPYAQDEFLRPGSEAMERLRAYDRANGTNLAQEMLDGKEFDYLFVHTEPGTNKITVYQVDPGTAKAFTLKQPGFEPVATMPMPGITPQPIAAEIPAFDGTASKSASWIADLTLPSLNQLNMWAGLALPALVPLIPLPMLENRGKPTDQSMVINITIPQPPASDVTALETAKVIGYGAHIR
ncbi:hypothetical protein DFR70_1327 [Nocardia tenerifensis]|uniref:Uncharacterized protein n=1 Tax=Nocardia tenerifensis TaxID=228006 RepID=A0A318JL87_9NOCA|nr:hypothetical protein [Nocardia tenerifensis]PXX52622.1 hypothetical protein DFR70_1327 [Nocardia tenerifensis]